MEKLTVEQAYLAAYIFLDQLQKRTHSDDLAGFLGDMAILQDGGTADPAAWTDWISAVEQARDEKNWGKAKFTLM